jgi:stage V sporulation protein D (sporulation-specific penicillin-binding protein)
LALIVLAFGFLAVQLYSIQITQGRFYQAKAVAQQLRPTTIPASRGIIYDRNMKRLAASSTVWTVVLSPAELESDAQLESIAGILSPLLNVSRESILEKGTQKSSYYEIIKQQVEKTQADAVTEAMRKENIRCVYLVEDSRRYYPYGNLAAAVLGFVNRDQTGAYGLESYYNKTLAGTPGLAVTEKTALSGDMPYTKDKTYQPIDGKSIVLTIDETIQNSLERHLKLAIQEYEVENRAVGIVMDVNTGAILAMTTQPDFNPNDPSKLTDPAAVLRLEAFEKEVLAEAQMQGLGTAQHEAKLAEMRKAEIEKERFAQWRNKAVSDPYEPGSVFKVITAAAALETDSVAPHGQYFTCTGSHIVEGRPKACWKTTGHGTIDFYQAVKFSCNPTFMMVGELLGAQKFDDYFKRFGLNTPTGVDLPGESDGFYYADFVAMDAQSDEYLASSSFGQTFKVTPIQIISAVAAAVNGGKLMQPYVVERILDADGRVDSIRQPTLIRHVISNETSALVADMMYHTVLDSDASGRFAYVPGYRVGGKTGTSEKLDIKEDGKVTKSISSFLGIAPSDSPKIAVLIMLDEPKIKNTTGAVAAAPVVGAVMSDILPLLDIEPEYTQKETEKTEVLTPKLSGKLIHDAIADLTALELSYKLEGEGTKVIAQYPAEKILCPKGSSVILYTDATYTPARLTVPNLAGMSAQQARRTVLNSGFNVKIINPELENTPAVVIRQEPLPQTLSEEATVVSIELGTATDPSLP